MNQSDSSFRAGTAKANGFDLACADKLVKVSPAQAKKGAAVGSAAKLNRLVANLARFDGRGGELLAVFGSRVALWLPSVAFLFHAHTIDAGGYPVRSSGQDLPYSVRLYFSTRGRGPGFTSPVVTSPIRSARLDAVSGERRLPVAL